MTHPIQTYRWTATVEYNDGRKSDMLQFDELRELHDLVEQRPDWNLIARITINKLAQSDEEVRQVVERAIDEYVQEKA